MKKHILLIGLMLTGIVSINAQSKAQLSRFADKVTTAFAAEELESLEPTNMRHGYVRLEIDNSIGEPEVERYRFSSFKTMARWFNKAENRGQAKVVLPLVKCRKGECEFSQDGGILHNHFYLVGISYGYRNKRLYVRKIQILAG
jgi:hypothetical protein